MSGIEPPSRAWQARVIAIIPHPQAKNKYVPRVRIEPTTSSFSEKRSTTELPRHIYKTNKPCGRYRTRTCNPLGVNEVL